MGINLRYLTDPWSCWPFYDTAGPGISEQCSFKNRTASHWSCSSQKGYSSLLVVKDRLLRAGSKKASPERKAASCKLQASSLTGERFDGIGIYRRNYESIRSKKDYRRIYTYK
jgi:hypothetical protein